ncbi:hypothetical protein CU663_20660 [Pseudomonas syringae pv. actinidifoliorum]|nr:hypothetical protein [Pseudomonas syringae pv. actinidifoliorum]
MRDALRHKSAPRCRFKIGRGASRTACDAERRTMINCVVFVYFSASQSSSHPHARSGAKCRSLAGGPC